MRLRRCKRVVAVAHCEYKIVLARAVKVLHGIDVFFKRVDNDLRVYSVPLEMSAAHIEVEIVHLFESFPRRPDRLDNRVLSVVDEKHNMRKFDGRVLSYFEARRYSVENHAFRRAYVCV